MRAEVGDVACRLFAEQGFDHTTVDQIAAEAGLSRTSFFRYFGTKEDVALVPLEGYSERFAAALAARPEEERPWQALRRAYDVITEFRDADPETLAYFRMVRETPSVRARDWERLSSWQGQLVPEVARRLGASPDDIQDVRACALVGSAIACVHAATDAWLACDGTTSMAVLLDRAMGALTE